MTSGANTTPLFHLASNVPTTAFYEVSERFTSLTEWLRWLHANPWSYSEAYCQDVVSDIKRDGMLDPLLGYIRPEQISIDQLNLRESVIAHGINSRVRGVIKLIFDEKPSRAIDVYAPESVTPLADILRNTFVGFIASEYLPTKEEKSVFPFTPHEDVEHLSFVDGRFDMYVSCEVMEHIPNVAAALSEAARVLRPGGQFIATFPFDSKSQKTMVKAVLENGQVKHLQEPEYHGNPVDPKGSLVFSIPGWDILDLARKCGFDRAEMVLLASRKFGIVAQSPSLIMRAVKQR